MAYQYQPNHYEMFPEEEWDINEIDQKDKEKSIVNEQREDEFCYICGQKVLHLDEHILSNHSENVKCHICNLIFSMGDLRGHILKDHGINRVTKCSICEKTFLTIEALKKHIQLIHLSEALSCQICHQEYNDLYLHVKYFHKSSYSKKKFKPNKHLNKDPKKIQIKVGETIKCLHCNKDISVVNFPRHMKEFHYRIKTSCPHCEKSFGKSNLPRHIKQVHMNESAECPECWKSLTLANMNKHIKSIHMKLKKTCDICNDEVPFSSFNHHKRKFHNTSKPVDEGTSGYRHIQNQTVDIDKLRQVTGKHARFSQNSECKLPSN